MHDISGAFFHAWLKSVVWTDHRQQCCQGLTVKKVMPELFDCDKPGEKVRMIIRTDSDSATGMLRRAGCDRVRHSATRYFWHQEALRDGRFAADLGTKMLDLEAMNRCMEKLQKALAAPSGRRGDTSRLAFKRYTERD